MMDAFERIPESVYADAPGKPNGHADSASQAALVERRAPLNWEDLESKQPPEREWITPYWIPHQHLTLLSGDGGIGKTLLAQHIGTAAALGGDYVEPMNTRRVLMWAGEDDEHELWRRQIPISGHFRSSLAHLSERFFLHSYSGSDITLMAPVYGKLTTTPMLGELREQVADYRAEFVILDNVARLFGGSENDRHAVTTFCALIQSACAPAAVLLLGHPAKAQGSEYSGSTAWEGAVRARLYLSAQPPDAEDEEEGRIDGRVRYLSRRKANYSARDIRRLNLADGLLIPESVNPEQRVAKVSGEFAKDVVRRAITKLAERGLHGSLSTASPNYLPKLAKKYDLLDKLTQKQFGVVMSQMFMGKEIQQAKVGIYESNRNPRFGLVLP